jgi:uncharacterized iron-regulated membrane protein
VFVVTMAASGCVILFRHELEYLAAPKITRQMQREKRVGLDVIAGQVATRAAGGIINRVVFPESESEPVLVQLKGKEGLRFYCDPFSGAVLGARTGMGWLDGIVELHHNLLLGDTGRALTGVIGTALFLLSFSGLFSWLNGPRNWKPSLALPKRGPLRGIAYQLHRSAGLWVNGGLLVISLTGIAQAYPDVLPRLVGSLSGESTAAQAAMSAHEGKRERLPLNDYIAAAQRAVPRSSVRELRLPMRGDNQVKVTLKVPGELRRQGNTTVFLNASSGEVIKTEGFSDMPASQKARELVTMIHFVEWGRWPVKVAWCLLGASPIALAVSGSFVWWIRRQADIKSERLRDLAAPLTASANAHVTQ